MGTLKLKLCNACKGYYLPYSTLSQACSIPCAQALVKMKRDKKEARIARKELKDGRDRLKTKSEWAIEAGVQFNRYIRALDPYGVCISCQKPPKKRNAGHFRSVGAAAELRYCLINVHLQCEYCNTHLSSNAIEYRINLVKKIGVDGVEWLEGPHRVKKYTIDDYKEIKRGFSEWARELEREL